METTTAIKSAIAIAISGLIVLFTASCVNEKSNTPVAPVRTVAAADLKASSIDHNIELRATKAAAKKVSVTRKAQVKTVETVTLVEDLSTSIGSGKVTYVGPAPAMWTNERVYM